MAFAPAEGEITRVQQDLKAAQHANDEARDRFHEGDVKRFKRVD